MKKKMIKVVITVVCAAGLVLGGTAAALARTAKTTIIGFADMAASVEKSHGTVLELDLSLRNDAPVYKADIIIGGERVVAYFNAVTGSEIERKDPVALDEEETSICNDYDIKSSVSSQGQTSSAAAGAQTSYSAGTQISYDQAKEIALAHVGGGTVTEIDLDHEHGVMVYEVEIKYNGVEYEVDINAATGEIVKYKTDD